MKTICQTLLVVLLIPHVIFPAWSADQPPRGSVMYDPKPHFWQGADFQYATDSGVFHINYVPAASNGVTLKLEKVVIRFGDKEYTISDAILRRMDVDQVGQAWLSFEEERTGQFLTLYVPFGRHVSSDGKVTQFIAQIFVTDMSSHKIQFLPRDP
jgi:hypothetical protein